MNMIHLEQSCPFAELHFLSVDDSAASLVQKLYLHNSLPYGGSFGEVG